MKRFVLSSIVAAAICISTSSFTSSPAAERYFKVAAVGQQISTATKAKLLSAFRAHYGKNASVKSIELEARGNRTWLYFLGGGDGTPTVGIRLDVVNGFLSIDLGGPVAWNNCNPKENCDCCNTNCECGKKNGGQVSCGTGECKEDKSDSPVPPAMRQVLEG